MTQTFNKRKLSSCWGVALVFFGVAPKLSKFGFKFQINAVPCLVKNGLSSLSRQRALKCQRLAWARTQCVFWMFKRLGHSSPNLAWNSKSHSWSCQAWSLFVKLLKKQVAAEPNYMSWCIVPESKHIKSAFSTCTEWNGKPPSVYDTPPTAQDIQHTHKVESNKAAIYRSVVGAPLYVSHDRGDIQYATKNLAANLKEPSETSSKMLGRLIGYLAKTGDMTFRCIVQVQVHLFSNLGGGGKATQLVIESFTGSDWSHKTTSCGVHFLSGNTICSGSRSQKASALSSTESEWYAAISMAIDQF